MYAVEFCASKYMLKLELNLGENPTGKSSLLKKYLKMSLTWKVGEIFCYISTKTSIEWVLEEWKNDLVYDPKALSDL